MNRRTFVSSTAALAALCLPTSAAVALDPTSFPADPLPESVSATGEPLNPPDIRTAGIRMVPVVGGKYKVWTKKVGSGSVKVLLLHGGPGASHEYFEVMESFLPLPASSTTTTISWAAATPISPTTPPSGPSRDTRRRSKRSAAASA
jgi:proline iminopeptidase